jgi:hypothetical protein
MDVKRVEKALAIAEKASGWVILHTMTQIQPPAGKFPDSGDRPRE